MMSLTFFCASGSPYAWRVWLALEHKGMPHELKMLSFDAGDLETPEFTRINPRQRVPAIVDSGFALYESGAILEYLDDMSPDEPRLFAGDAAKRAVQRRMIQEADQYVGEAMHKVFEAVGEHSTPEKVEAARKKMADELARWEPMIAGDFLAGPLSAVDFTLYPMLALVLRLAERRAPALAQGLMGPKLTAWMTRMKALPLVQKTWPPHWK
jgi:glutathione S-transferase